MAAITEQCSVCEKGFDVTFRYQMEERDGAFVFFCSQECLGQSHATPDQGEKAATCDACAKRFRVTLASQIDALVGSTEGIDSQVAVATRSLEDAGSDAVALHRALQGLLATVDTIVATEVATAQEILTGVEAGNRRQIDTMNRRLGAGAGDLQAAIVGSETDLFALRLMLFESGGTTSDGILATEAFGDPQSNSTVRQVVIESLLLLV